MNRKNNKGFTMAEMLITVAILVVLAGLIFVGVASHLKNMHQLEMDAVAKEIFITAQNHLSMADGQGFPNVSVFGESLGDSENAEKGIYYYVVTDGVKTPAAADGKVSLIDLMLPDGAIDATVIGNGSFIVRYQKAPAKVLDVFYATTHSNSFFKGYPLNGGFSQAYYSELISKSGVGDESAYQYIGFGDTQKQNRKDFHGAVIGWYGGGDELAHGAELKAPSVKVENGETLQVEIKDNNTNKTGYKVQLIIKGLTSKGQAYRSWDTPGSLTNPILLDTICESKKHFGENFVTASTDPNTLSFVITAPFYPGENISVQAKVFSTSVLTNVATSETIVTNSLFDTGSTVDAGTKQVHAIIHNFRHLENLSKEISGCGDTTKPSTNPVAVQSAVQTADLSWQSFTDNHADGENGTYVYLLNQTAVNSAQKNKYQPVKPAKALSYDGGYHSITGVTAAADGAAGLFAEIVGESATNNSTIKNLELIDFSISGTESGGALAGSLKYVTVTNVLAHNSDDSVDKLINATDEPSATSPALGSAGGLIGAITDCSINESAAAVIVKSDKGNAGGLIGTAGGSSSTLTGCYSGGHTRNGSYKTWIELDDEHTYDVTGAVAGGLVGDAGSAGFNYSYSTCSVTGTTTAGGFAGKADGNINKCYAVGLVGDYIYAPTADIPANAFVGGGNPTFASGVDSYYYRIVNEVSVMDGTAVKEIKYKEPGADSVKALDENAASYDVFVGNTWMKAEPYDADLAAGAMSLKKVYGGEYNLQTVSQLGMTVPANYYVNTHYGDWPAPEIFIINN